jgi:hypothetical protein
VVLLILFVGRFNWISFHLIYKECIWASEIPFFQQNNFYASSLQYREINIAEPDHYAAPAPDKNFDVVPATIPYYLQASFFKMNQS